VTLVWPLPALLTWVLAWGVFAALRWCAAPLWLALLLAAGLGLASSLWGRTRWRRVLLAAGFPLSLLFSGIAGAAGELPAWAWLLPLALLALLYPVHTWRDAPMFPTPRGALSGLARSVPLQASARILDAGCGLGDGLRELRRAYPQSQLVGLEWSWPLRIACGWRTRFATVRRADIWAAEWSGFEMVYLFQRPESLPRAVAKAARELRPGAWLASLEFDALSLIPQAVHHCPDGRALWLYRAPFQRR
jgi:SAM-dependent methyltransferase